MSSNELCKACTLLEGLERGVAASGIVSMSSWLYVPSFSPFLPRLSEHVRDSTPKAQLPRTYAPFHFLNVILPTPPS